MINLVLKMDCFSARHICCSAIINEARQSEITACTVYTSDKVFFIFFIAVFNLLAGGLFVVLSAVKKSVLKGFLITSRANRTERGVYFS